MATEKSALSDALYSCTEYLTGPVVHVHFIIHMDQGKYATAQ